MMIYRHIEELDSAVRLANHVLLRSGVREEERLSRYLYQRWYLGGHQPQPRVHATQTWHTWSPTWSAATQAMGSELVRLSLAVATGEAARVVSLVTAHAMSWDEPWRFTSTAVNDAPAPSDSTALYLPIDSLGRLRGDLQTMLTQLRPVLRADTPALTLPVGHGAALAQNPDDGRGFGEHRCTLVARAVLCSPGAHHQEQVRRATTAFAEAGVDPDRPYRHRLRGTWDRAWRSY